MNFTSKICLFVPLVVVPVLYFVICLSFYASLFNRLLLLVIYFYDQLFFLWMYLVTYLCICLFIWVWPQVLHDKEPSSLDDSKAKADWHVVTPDVRGCGPKSPAGHFQESTPNWNVKNSTPVCRVCFCSVVCTETPSKLQKEPKEKAFKHSRAVRELKFKSKSQNDVCCSKCCLLCSCNTTVGSVYWVYSDLMASL